MRISRRAVIWVFAWWLAALPLAIGADFEFAILGDRTGNATPGVYEKVCREIGARHPALVINVGDTIQRTEDAKAEGEWEAVRPVWRSFGDVPFYLVPGNHDIWSPASEKIWRTQTGHPPTYSFDFRGAHFTVLDNSRTDDLAPDQLAFLKADLAAHAAAQPKFIFFHRPFWILNVKFGNGDFELHRLAREYHAGFVVTGHLHAFDRSELQGVQYLVVGSSGGSLMHGNGNGANPKLEGSYFGYAWAHVREDGGAVVEFCRLP
jgi:predicted phosphodiesterase